MEKMLKQDEIDALFQSAKATSHAAAVPTAAAESVVPFNFGRAGQISNEQLRAISMLNDLFARNLTHNLAAWLRCQFQVNLVSAEQIPFNEFLMRIPDISYVTSVRLEPLGALSVIQLDLALAPPIIDLLLGGEGGGAPARTHRYRRGYPGKRSRNDLSRAYGGMAVGWAQLQLRAPPNADTGGSDHVCQRKDTLPKL